MDRSPVIARAVRSWVDQQQVAAFHVTSGSMAPLVRAGDVIIVRKAPTDRLVPGDVVVMNSDGAMIVHRLLRKRRSRQGLLLVTKGDLHSRKDSPWNASEYVGRVEGIHKPNGRVDLTSLRWRTANRIYGALANVECEILTSLNGGTVEGNRLGTVIRWLGRAVRAPGKSLLVLTLLGRSHASITAQQRRRFLYACLHADHPTVEGFCRLLRMDDHAWAEVLAEAERCKLLPLLHDCLRRHRHRVPRWVIERAARAHLRSYAHNLNLKKNLQELLRAFHAANTPVVVLKGGAFLDSVEPLAAARPTSDLDLLVREQDRARAAMVLDGMGFQPLVKGKATTLDNMAQSQEGNQTAWISQERRAAVEIHTHLLATAIPFTVDMDSLWRGTTPLMVGGERALALRPEQMLLHVALHASWIHAYSFGMKWLYDIALIVRSCEGQLDWREFLRCTQAWGATRTVYWPLSLARELLGVDIPIEVLDELRPRKVTCWVTRWLLKRLDVYPGRRNPPEGDDRVATTLYRQVTAGPGVSLGTRLKLFVYLLFPETRLAVRGHKPSPSSVLAGMMTYLRPSKLRRARRTLIKSTT